MRTPTAKRHANGYVGRATHAAFSKKRGRVKSFSDEAPNAVRRGE